MAGKSIRLKILTAVDKHPHRYNRLRAIAQLITIAILFAVPVTGLVRIDFWQADHRLFFQPADFKIALAGVIVGIAAMYVVTFVSNIAAGRMFCGWGCPVAQINRIGEQVATGRTAWKRWANAIWGAAYSALFILGMTAWWIDLRVLFAGLRWESVIVWSIFAVGAAWGFIHSRYIRWSFCKTVCPIGMYYSIVSPASYFGIHFRNEDASCIECDACDHICPVDLQPRDLLAPMTEPRGLSVTDAPSRNHCIECGDCVKACEYMIDRTGGDNVPLALGWYQGPQRVDHDDIVDIDLKCDTVVKNLTDIPTADTAGLDGKPVQVQNATVETGASTG